MGEVFFYHLTASPMEVTLPTLITRALSTGWKVAVRSTSEDRLDWLDQKLWLGEGFLPHGRAGGPHDSDQPVLLTTAREMPNGAACLMVVDGADVGADEVGRLSRTCILFDGNNEVELDRARWQWRSLTAAGHAAQYWSQSDGSWKKKAEHPGG